MKRASVHVVQDSYAASVLVELQADTSGSVCAIPVAYCAVHIATGKHGSGHVQLLLNLNLHIPGSSWDAYSKNHCH